MIKNFSFNGDWEGRGLKSGTQFQTCITEWMGQSFIHVDLWFKKEESWDGRGWFPFLMYYIWDTFETPMETCPWDPWVVMMELWGKTLVKRGSVKVDPWKNVATGENKAELIEHLQKAAKNNWESECLRKARLLLCLLCFLAERSEELKIFYVWLGCLGFSRLSWALELSLKWVQELWNVKK